VLYDWHNSVVGVATGDMGIAKDGSSKPSFTPGVDLMARLTLFGEGARGSLSQVRAVVRQVVTPQLRAAMRPAQCSLHALIAWHPLFI
jgi:flavin-dependent dehydrogenase